MPLSLPAVLCSPTYLSLLVLNQGHHVIHPMAHLLNHAGLLLHDGLVGLGRLMGRALVDVPI